MSTPKFTLKAFERLKSKKQIGRLFTEGKSQFKFPFKLFYIIEPIQNDADWPLLFSVSIPKKKIKLAVKRNLLKRRTREAYRINKLPLDKLLKEKRYKVSLMFVYLENDVKEYSDIEKSIIKHIDEIYNKINNLS
ncbi:MAG: ribonuclease P protein component [Saprospiraceae bacterium]|nr:ribonuclease P protein component [Bacteroidia bacterium]NNE13590.1 ribonuclease P protein component [Saprospiraceae bacterium]NNL92927.1 ribonuclease P protein component [Saprospiraceae bacterium]